MIKIEGNIPSVNHTYRVSRGKLYMEKSALKYKNKLAAIAIQSGVKKTHKSVRLIFEWHNKRLGRGDLDNKIKIIQDALQGIAYKNDSQILEIRATKVQHSDFDGALIKVEEIV